jgi:acetate---CoA ligase (ADP-forming)
VALSVDLVYEYDNDDSYERALFDARAETTKPLVLVSNLRSAIDPAAAARLREAGVPVLEGTRTGMLAMRHLLEWRDAKERSSPIAHPIDERRRRRWSDRIRAGGLSGTESLELLADYGIQVTRTALAKTREEALARSVEIGLPVVLKTDVPGIDHKSDVGGVLVGIATEDAVGRAYDDLASRLGPEVLVAEAVSDGVEVALGVVRDRSVGPIVMVGAGGVLVEYIADRSVSIPPVDIAIARRMIESLNIRALLAGSRGREPSDVEALARALVSISVLATELEACLDALDVNPLRCGPNGVVALDALIVPRT